MLNSMTGFGSKERAVLPYGKICVELRSSNHKFQETVLHLPEGFLSLEEKAKKEIESRIKRGRVTCVVNITGGHGQGVFINKRLLKDYILALKNIKRQFQIQDSINMDTLIHLPGVLSLAENKVSKERIWPDLKILINQALDALLKTRQKEGRALYGYLKGRAESLKSNLSIIKQRFKKAVQKKISQMRTDEERVNFLKDTDITEEIERLTFHINNFQSRLHKNGPIGKELDFVAQEMQREANTMSAKSWDVVISSRVVQIKSQIEKIREQVQNIE